MKKISGKTLKDTELFLTGVIQKFNYKDACHIMLPVMEQIE